MRAETVEPSIRGTFICTAKDWVIATYGRDLWNRALSTLSNERQTLFGFELVASSWYPMQGWTQVLDAVRAEVLIKTGEDSPTFDRRMVFESINGAMDRIFRVAFKFLSPTTAIAKMVPYFQRVYSHGNYSVTLNEVGHCCLRLSEMPVEMSEEVHRAFPIASRWMLDVAGQQVTELRFLPKTLGKTLSADVLIDYLPKRRPKG